MTRVWESLRRDGAQNVVLIITAVALLLPLIGAAVFGLREPDGSFTFSQVERAVGDRGFMDQLTFTLVLAVLTTVGLYLLLIPTLVWMHLRVPRALPIAETLSIIPYVIPPVALVNGANLTFRPLFPAFLANEYALVPFYVILAMPLVYRSVDAGIRAMDLPTLYQASTSLGAGALRTLLSVVLPNLKSALLTGGLLAFTLVLGEFAIAQLLLQNTFPVFLQGLGQNAPRAAAAMAFIVIVGTWALLSLFTSVGSRRSTAVSAVAPSTPVKDAKGTS